MAVFNIPSSPEKNIFKINSFLGVDFTSDINEIDIRRTPNGKNFINNNGAIEKINGYKKIVYLGDNARINGMWNVDTTRGEFFVVHCGTKLYEMQTDFSSYQVILEGLANKTTTGIILANKLIILDGKRAIGYDVLSEQLAVGYLDEMGYIPTIQIARSPDGLVSQAYENENLLQSQKIVLFTSTETAKEYVLPEKNISEVIKVEVLNDNAEWVENTSFTTDLIEGKIIFNEAIGLPVVDGRDNVRVRYSKENTSYKSQVNKCNMLMAYGYNGRNNRLFIAGNPDYPNTITYSAINDPTYFPADAVVNTGLNTVPIKSMVRLNSGTMAALKDVSDTDSTMFNIGYAMYNGKEVFTVQGSANGEGCISNSANAYLLNEPLVLTHNGIFAINGSTINDEKFAYHRSYYVDGKLLKEENLESALGCSYDGKYYLAINDNVYVADARFKTTNKNSRLSNYQYEWYFWTDIPVSLWFVWNNELYFGDKSGNICKFRDDADENRYLNDTLPVKSYWRTPFLNLGSISYKKTIKRIFISSNPTTSEMTVGYITKKGEKNVIEKLYIDSTFPKVTTIRKQAKKISYISLYIESESEKSMSFNDIAVVYTFGTFYKGD